MSSKYFLDLGKTMLGHRKNSAALKGDIENFRAHFGISSVSASTVWKILKKHLPKNTGPKYLLWTLFKLKTYASDIVCASVYKTSRKTFEKWFWIVLKAFVFLPLVSEQNDKTFSTETSIKKADILKDLS